MLQVASIGPKPPVQQQTAASALREEDEDEEAAASAVRKAKAEDSQAAKRQKLSGPASNDSELAQQPIAEARMVAAATKNALGLTGRA